MLRAGDQAPHFELPDEQGAPCSLPSLLAHGPIILYFYPADFTPVCTEQACFFRDAASELAAAGVRVVGISADPADQHQRFRTQHNLGFTLLSDPDHRVAQAYRARGLFGLLPFGSRRVTYLIRPPGVVADAVAQELGLGSHRAFVRRSLAAIGQARETGRDVP